MLRTLLLLCFTTAFCAQAQESILPSTVDDFEKYIQAEELKKHLSVLASDGYEGRETGKKGQRLAADYLSTQFRKLGLPAIGDDSSYFQNFDLTEKVWGDVFISLNGTKYEFGKDFYTYHRFTPASKLIRGEVLFLGYGVDDKSYSDYDEVEVKDKLLIVLNGDPLDKNGVSILTGKSENSGWSTNYRRKPNAAKLNGARALMIVVPDIEKAIEKNNHRIYYSRLRLGIHQEDIVEDEFQGVFYISEAMMKNMMDKSGKDVEKLKAKMSKKGQSLNAKLKSKVEIHVNKDARTVKSQNVLGFIEGTDYKDEVIVMSAHYDHIGEHDGEIYNGADDDGSGTVALLELAEAFKMAEQRGYRPKRSLLFLPVAGEEKGLLGSRFYTSNPIFPLANTVANLNIDMIGRVDEDHADDKDYVYIIGSDFLSSELHDVNEKANQSSVKLNLDYKYNNTDDPNRFYYRSDHYNFAKNQVPVIFYFNGTHADYHKASDTIEKIDFDLMEKRVKLIFHTAWRLANMEQRVEVDPDKLIDKDAGKTAE